LTTNNATTTLGSCQTKVCNPEISASDNRFAEDQNNDSVIDYDYDANGNLTLDAQNQRFVYDAENHQKQFFNGANNTSTPDATYHYDGEGKRVKKVSGTETVIFVYNAGRKLAAEYSTALAQAPQVSYMTADHLGSPRVITNKNGAVTSRKDYAAFGEETLSAQRTIGLSYSAPDEIRKDYTGYEKDEESGLDFAQARYYNPNHGRFTSVDPLTASAAIKNPQTFNRYSYVLNSPYKFLRKGKKLLEFHILALIF
jgi:RHS repeat-associated protein